MSAIEDPLSKPEWPVVNSEDQQTILNLLYPHTARGHSSSFLIGFNSVMQAIEQQTKLTAMFVVRSDLDATECLPLAVLSAAQHIPLITLPAGSTARLSASVLAITEKFEDPLLLNLVGGVSPAKLSWVYTPAQLIKKQKKKNNKPKVDKTNA